MLKRIGVGTHVVVGAAVVVTAVLGGFRIVGAGDQSLFRAEHFDAKQVTVTPAGDDGVRIREVVDIDFGVHERRGYQRIVPNDFGMPTDVEATSLDANGELGIVGLGSDTRIRVGNPDITFNGQHRYQLEYTLPAAQTSSGRLALDIIGDDETFTTDRFDVWLTGFELDDPTCDTGPRGAFGGCDLVELERGTYRVTFEPLDPGDGITVSGDIVAFTDPAPPEVPALPERNPAGFQPIGIVQLLVGALLALAIFFGFRRRGSNEVFGGGGAADAAFIPAAGELPVPAPGDPSADVPTHRVPDSRLAELATIEFVPPRGVEPWQGAVLLRERVGSDTVSAWFSEMIARGAIGFGGGGSAPVLHPGQTDARLSAVDRGHLVELFKRAPVITLGTYDPEFAAAWKGIQKEQERFIRDSGWWERPIAGTPQGDGTRRTLAALVTLAAVFGVLAAIGLAAWLLIGVFGVLSTALGAVLVTAVVTFVFAGFGYSSMLAARTATGSALTLRTESFRRFLEASEGRHVEWAWEQGLIREYSAWAVALDAADAWSKAIDESPIDPPASVTAPLLMHTYSNTISSSYSAPSSSGSGGGGGGSGGGGGGGSSGSW